MTHIETLFEFLHDLINIQIKKYEDLASFGIGPDARINASLVLQEVNELIKMSQDLLTVLESPDTNNILHFHFIFHQIRFYLEQEYRRAYAGWLIDENPIHTQVFTRTKAQLQQLKQLAQDANIDIRSPATPQTPTQEQCEHDSYAIAFKILDIAITLKTNPETDLTALKIPAHAHSILKKHAHSPNGRYFNPTFADPINALHEEYKKLLGKLPIALSQNTLDKNEALKNSKIHREMQEATLLRYRSINSTSKFGKTEKPKPSSSHCRLFALSIALSASTLYFLHTYLTSMHSQNLSNTP